MRLVGFLLLPVCFATTLVDDLTENEQFNELHDRFRFADKTALKNFLSSYKDIGIGQCLSSRRQSPINIDLGNVTVVSLPSLKFEHYTASEPVVESKKNNFTATVNGYANWTSRPMISGGPLKGNYSLTEVSWETSDLQMMSNYYHYGHTINKAKQDSELHFIHTINGLPVEEAKKIPNGIVILGVFINQVPDALNDMTFANETVFKIPDTPGVEFEWVPPQLFLPQELDSYFVYNGTFSHPPCDGDVTWIILAHPAQLTQRERYMFLQFTSGQHGSMALLSPTKKENYNVLFNHPVLVKEVIVESSIGTVLLAILAAIVSFVAVGALIFYAKEKFRRKRINGDSSKVNYQIGFENLNFNN